MQIPAEAGRAVIFLYYADLLMSNMSEIYAQVFQTADNTLWCLLYPCIHVHEMARNLYDTISPVLNCWNFPVSLKDTMQ